MVGSTITAPEDTLEADLSTPLRQLESLRREAKARRFPSDDQAGSVSSALWLVSLRGRLPSISISQMSRSKSLPTQLFVRRPKRSSTGSKREMRRSRPPPM